MSEKNNDIEKTQSALRILEALSGVDEELMQRSEFRRRPYWSYGRAAAACLALVVVGVISWNGLWTKDSARPTETEEGTMSELPTVDEAMPQPRAGNLDVAASNESNTDGAVEEGNIEDANTGVQEETLDITQENAEQENGESEKLQELESDRSDGAKTEDCVDPLVSRQELTEEEARNTEVWGQYIPDNLPAGYSFENAWESDQGITITWTRGMDSIMISLSLVVPENVVTADVEKPETYDERLYEIPYADTVPREYREVFQDPVFLAEDLSLEVVSSRMKSVADAGDTDTPRGIFSVLYQNGIMLRFNGRGTADEIWGMLCSVIW